MVSPRFHPQLRLSGCRSSLGLLAEPQSRELADPRARFKPDNHDEIPHLLKKTAIRDGAVPQVETESDRSTSDREGSLESLGG